MTKWRIVIDGEPEDELYDTYEEAEEAANEAASNMKEGAYILHLSNPGDYEYDEDSWYDEGIEIEEVEVDE